MFTERLPSYSQITTVCTSFWHSVLCFCCYFFLICAHFFFHMHQTVLPIACLLFPLSLSICYLSLSLSLFLSLFLSLSLSHSLSLSLFLSPSFNAGLSPAASFACLPSFALLVQQLFASDSISVKAIILSPRRHGTGVNCSIHFADAAELRRAFELCEKMERQFSPQVRLSEVEVDHGNKDRVKQSWRQDLALFPSPSHSSPDHICNTFSCV